MSQQVQELIDKIKNEGVQEAEKTAKEIESQAQEKANAIIEKANSEAHERIQKAKVEIQTLQDSANMALKQASRDALLSLRQEINHVLQNVIETDVKQALSSNQLAGILEKIIKSYIEKNDAQNLEVVLNQDDLNALKDGALSNLQQQLKSNISLRSSDSAARGFTISFDQGKSCFDFTDESLASYLATYLNANLSSMVQEAVKI